jgi:hypothetical protein
MRTELFDLNSFRTLNVRIYDLIRLGMQQISAFSKHGVSICRRDAATSQVML